PDGNRLEELEQVVRLWLAWKSIREEQDQLNLDTFQRNQAKTQMDRAADTIAARIPETFTWLLVPKQEKAGPLEWQEIRLQGADALAVRAAKRLRNDDLLVTVLAGTSLRLEMDKIPLWRGD